MIVLSAHSIVKYVFRNCAVNRYRTIPAAGTFACRSDNSGDTHRSGTKAVVLRI